MDPQTSHYRTGYDCRIIIQNHLDYRWLSWFEDLNADYLPGGHVILCGFMPDQPALFGLLNRLRDLNLKVICISIKERKEEKYSDYVNAMCKVLQRSSIKTTDKEMNDETL